MVRFERDLQRQINGTRRKRRWGQQERTTPPLHALCEEVLDRPTSDYLRREQARSLVSRQKALDGTLNQVRQPSAVMA